MHFGIDNRTGKQLGFFFRIGDNPGGGDNAVVGKSEITRSDLPPGRVLVICFDARGDRLVPTDPGAYVHLDVSDEEGLWTSPDLDCAEPGGVTGFSDYIAGAKGVIGDPVDLARAHFKGLRATDVVTGAGYPE